MDVGAAKKAVSRVMEINLKHLDLTIVSDYVEELELFYIHIKVFSF